MMSQKEYIYTMETNHDNLKRAWEAGERVQTLKIAIQSAKLLGDLSVPQFYPSAFVLISDILDTFGNLVYDRIKKKGAVDAGGAAISLPGAGPQRSQGGLCGSVWGLADFAWPASSPR